MYTTQEMVDKFIVEEMYRNKMVLFKDTNDSVTLLTLRG